MAEPLNRDLISLKNQLNKTNENEDEAYEIKKMKEIIEKAKNTAESDEAEYVFGVFYKTIVEFETDLSILRSQLEEERSKVRSMMREEEERLSLLPDGDDDVAERVGCADVAMMTWHGVLGAVCGGRRRGE